MPADRFHDAVRKLAAEPVLAVLLASGGLAQAESLTLIVKDADGRPVANAVVMLRSLDRELPLPAPVNQIVDQTEMAFKPAILVVPLGSKISFPNSDIVSHQVYSFSAAKKFQLPLYRGKPYPPITFDAPGVVTLGCNIHDSMLGHVVVSDAPFNGVADANGAWLVPKLAPGNYQATIWHPRLRGVSKPWTQNFLVAPDQGSTTLTVQSAQKLKSDKPAVARSGWDSY